jgi:hypothetical protein
MVSDMVALINEVFDGCRVFIGYSSEPMTCPRRPSMQRYVDVPVEPATSPLRANAYPNPYGRTIQFSLTAPVAGQAELTLYDLSGRQLAQLYKGYWNAGDWRLLTYSVKPGQFVPMIYQFRVGKETVTGKLMPGN